ncbi:hypothetical protein VTN77DRAFT_5283 [Rasamsonia byssochlamydoides]|uniref:uncharacterized protein n=1 Tax=Rasamsonia byssochlamydoides TaxID=89139 RepID=UPI00374291B6
MAFYPRFSPGDFSSLFRLLDDYDVHRSTRPSASHHHNNNKHRLTPRSFAPKFDVREANDSYLLDGELPGVQQKDVEIEFTDPYTLVIKGRSEYEYNNDDEQDEDMTDDSQDDSSSSRSKSLQPTVEDADDEDATGNESTTITKVLSTSSDNNNNNNNNNKLTKSTTKGKAVQKSSKQSVKYWISERRVGEFRRTFSFPTRVNQDAVKASLRNGILSIVVPKEPAHVVKKIRIE